MNISKFDDIVVLAAIIRPGTADAGTIDHYIDRKAGVEEVTCIDDSLKEVLASGMGFPIFQEDVMKMAQVYAGFTLAEADKLRRAVAKKKPKEMVKVKKMFQDKSVLLGRDSKRTDEVFAYIEFFSSYGFCRAHSTAYSKIAVQQMWLKHNYPVQYMSELLNGELDSNEPKIEEYVNECRILGHNVVPPLAEADCDPFCAPDGEGGVRIGLAFIKGVSVNAAKGLSEAVSKAEGPGFSGWAHLMDSSKLHSNAVEAMIRAGAFDHMGASRDLLSARYKAVSVVAKKIREQRKKVEAGVKVKKFTPVEEMVAAEANAREAYPATDKEDELRLEKELLGAFVSESPCDQFREETRDWTNHTVRDFVDGEQIGHGDHGVLACVVRKAEHIIAKKGKNLGRKMLFLTLADGCHDMEIACFPDQYEALPPIDEGAVYLFTIERYKSKDSVKDARRLSKEVVN
jgi:DNA polymerase-3 subunit alpha